MLKASKHVFQKAFQFIKFRRQLVKSQHADAGQIVLDSDQDIYDTVIMRHTPIEHLSYVQSAVVVLELIIRPETAMGGTLQFYYIVGMMLCYLRRFQIVKYSPL